MVYVGVGEKRIKVGTCKCRNLRWQAVMRYILGICSCEDCWEAFGSNTPLITLRGLGTIFSRAH
jgi:hypothetical protein